MSNLTYYQYPRSGLYVGTWRQLRRNRSRNEMPWDQPKSIQGDIEKHGLISAQLQLSWSRRRPRSSRLTSLCTPRWPRPASTLHAPKRFCVWGRVCVGVHVIVPALAGTIRFMFPASNDRSQWPIHVGPLHDPEAGRRDMAYWMSRPAEERMAELDRLREEHDGPQPRLARVAVVIERQRR